MAKSGPIFFLKKMTNMPKQSWKQDKIKKNWIGPFGAEWRTMGLYTLI